MSDADGIALFSTAPPIATWYRRMWFWLRRPRISPESLETIDIDIEVEICEPLRPRRDLLQDYYNSKWAGVYMSDNEIEQEIQAKGLIAPRVTLAQVEACIAYEYYATGSDAFMRATPVVGPAWKAFERADITPLSCLTLCVLMLRNGFTVTGESKPVHNDNFDAELGRKVARQNAVSKIWLLEGYLLKEQLHRDSINRSSGGGDFGDS